MGAVNGGIWRTFNATAANPTWTPLTDTLPSLSIGALELDPTDATHQTLIAAFGRISSFYGDGGARIGVLRSTDGGSTWAILGASQLANYNLTSVAARGNTLMAAGDSTWGGGTDGLVRSTDGGSSFQVISGGAGTGLPAGPVSDLVGDPGNPTRFYAAVVRVGVFRSDNSGATWNNVTPGITGIGSSTVKIEMAVHSSATANAVYVGVINNYHLAGVFRSANQGASWIAMDVPDTNPEGQGALHFSIVADPTSPTIVYVGGDTGPRFRGDAALAPGSQFVSIGDHFSSTYPHDDSREMVFDANGNIIETDDGGIYRRSAPRSSAGAWGSVIGNLAVIEAHDVAYDGLVKVAIVGTQDNGVLAQTTSGSSVWGEDVANDGGDIAIDDTSTPGYSIRYEGNNYGSLFRSTYDSANNLVSSAVASLAVQGGGPPIQPQFVTPIALNKINPLRIVIGAGNGVYESMDRGETVTALAPGFSVNRGALAYGGWLNTTPNPDVIYYGSGSSVRVRTTAGGPISATASPFPGGGVGGIALDTRDWRRTFVSDSSRVYSTPDAGASWTEVTGNLTGVGSLRCLGFVSVGRACVVAGTDAGVYCSFADALGNWLKLGTGLPNAPVFDVAFSATDNLLIAGTLGRGAWKLSDLSTSLAPLLLHWQLSGRNLLISWPSPSTGFVLQQSTNLTTGSWTNVVQIPNDDGTNKSVTVPASSGKAFYRLLKPGLSTVGPKLVQHASNLGHSVSSVSKAFPSPNTAGNLIVVAAAGGGTMNVSDSLGNSYAAAINNYVGGGGSGHLYVWYAKNAKGGANTVTVSSSGDYDMQIYEVSGADAAAPLDKTGTSYGTGGAPSVSTPTTSTANEWVFAFLFDWLHSISFTAGSGYTLEEYTHNTAGSQSSGGEDKIVASAGGQTATMSGVGSDAWMFGIATFRAAGAGP